jgi:hypothetical protein
MKKSNHNPTLSQKTYTLSPHLKWLVETNGIYIIKEDTEDGVFLKYPEAAIWDLVSQGCDLNHIIPFINHICSTDSYESNRIIMTSIEQWADLGFIKGDD